MTGKKRGGGKGQMPFPALYFFVIGQLLLMMSLYPWDQ